MQAACFGTHARVGDLNSQALANATQDFSRLLLAEGAVSNVIRLQYCVRANGFQPQNATNVAWAWSTLQTTDMVAVDFRGAAVTHATDMLGVRNLANASWKYSGVRAMHDSLIAHAS